MIHCRNFVADNRDSRRNLDAAAHNFNNQHVAIEKKTEKSFGT
jgi:hypothetical protein